MKASKLADAVLTAAIAYSFLVGESALNNLGGQFATPAFALFPAHDDFLFFRRGLIVGWRLADFRAAEFALDHFQELKRKLTRCDFLACLLVGLARQVLDLLEQARVLRAKKLEELSRVADDRAVGLIHLCLERDQLQNSRLDFARS